MKSKYICNNIKSRHYPNEQCKNKSVINEDFCAKHLKNPHRFIEKNITNIIKIQKCWRKYVSRKYYKTQGPARNNLSISNNTTDVYTLEPIHLIPKIYIFSYSDINKNIWCFDIRTLSFLLSKSKEIKNPYTRDIITKDIIKKIQNRLKWLNQKKYQTMYIENSNFSSEQIWNQNVLDIFSKIEELGYLVNSDWFHEMDKDDHINFYKKLYHLWNYRLNLTDNEKKLIVPSYQSNKNKLFKIYIDEVNLKDEKFLKKQNLQIIERLVSSALDKSQKSLGAMYVIIGLYYVNTSVGESYPWLLDIY